MNELERELRAVGIGGRSLRRILTETSAHEPAALGDPHLLAVECAEALAPRVARRGVAVSLAGLAVAAVVVLGEALTIHVHASSVRESLAFGSAFVAGQVAFVAGSLAAWRALRRPRDTRTIARRSLAGVVAGGAAVVLTAVAAHSLLPLAALVLLAAALPFVARGLVLRTAGDAGDDFPFRLDPRVVAAGAGTVVFLAGVAAGDPLDGLLRGVLEGLACLGGYVTLGRFLGLGR